MEKIIQFKNIAKSFENLDVMKNISFEVGKDDIIGILGPSGVGKSTILKLISNLEKPTSGELINNVKKIGYVFQEPRLLPWKTTLDNVLLPLLADGLEQDEAIKKALHYLEKMGLKGFEDYFPSQLSGGMLQRVSLARAFVLEPGILLLDEPFSALDIRLKLVLEDILKNMLKERPIPVLYVSHSPDDIIKFVNRIFMLLPGGILEEIEISKDIVKLKETLMAKFMENIQK